MAKPNINETVATYNAMNLHTSGMLKSETPKKITKDLKDDELVALYSEKYKDTDDPHRGEKKKGVERFKQVINFIKHQDFCLEVGCGDGSRIKELLNSGIKGVGLDISITNILRGREKYSHINFIHGFAEEIPFIDDFFDTVILGDVIERVREPTIVLAECIRVARKTLLLLVPLREKIDEEFPSAFSIQKIERILIDFNLHFASFSIHEEIIEDPYIDNLSSTSRHVLIKADITQAAKNHIKQKVKNSRTEIKRNFSAIIEKDQWKNSQNLIRHDTEVARFTLVSNLIEGNRVLEMGCGNGDGITELVNRGLEVIGTDISSYGVKEAYYKHNAIKKNHASFCIMDSFITAFKESSFDTVIIPEVLEHIRSSRLIIQEAIRIVRNGGRIIISVPDGLLVPWEGHIRVFFKDTLVSEIQQYARDIEWHTLPFQKWLICSFFVEKLPFNLQIQNPIDIIMATYNGLSTVKKSIESVLHQTYPYWNLIIVNDGGESPIRILEKINDSRITYYETEHRGKSHALNFGIFHSKSKYITYLDDDDIIYPLHLEILLNGLEKTKSEFAFVNWYEVDLDQDGNEFNREVQFNEEINSYLLFFQNYINHKCILHTRDLLEKVGPYDEELAILIDWDMIRRMAIISHPKQIISFTSEHRKYHFQGTLKNQFTSLWFSNDPKVSDKIKRTLLRIITKDLLHTSNISELKEIINRAFEILYFQKIFPGIIKTNKLLVQVEERDSRLIELYAQVEERDSRLIELYAQVEERDSRLIELYAQVEERDSRLIELYAQVEERDSRLIELYAQVEERDSRLIELYAQVEERDSRLIELYAQVEERDSRIKELYSQVEERDSGVKELYAQVEQVLIERDKIITLNHNNEKEFAEIKTELNAKVDELESQLIHTQQDLVNIKNSYTWRINQIFNNKLIIPFLKRSNGLKMIYKKS